MCWAVGIGVDEQLFLIEVRFRLGMKPGRWLKNFVQGLASEHSQRRISTGLYSQDIHTVKNIRQNACLQSKMGEL